MAVTIGQDMLATLRANGVGRVHGVPGDSLNGFTDALRRDGTIDFQETHPQELFRVCSVYVELVADRLGAPIVHTMRGRTGSSSTTPSTSA